MLSGGVCVVGTEELAGGSALCYLALPGLGDAPSGRATLTVGTQLAGMETLPRLLPHPREYDRGTTWASQGNVVNTDPHYPRWCQDGND